MRYPKLQALETTRLLTNVFTGYDHRMIGRDGSFYYTSNITCDEYPVLATRRKRGTVKTLTAPQGLIEKDAPCWVDNGTLYVNGLATPVTGLSSGEKQLVSMGAYVCIFPDKVYYNTENAADYGSMEASWSYSGNVTYAPCHADGSAFGSVYVGDDEPDSAQFELWIDTGSGGVAMTWSVSYGAWVQLDTIYTKLTFTTQGQIPALFKEGDGVEISGAYFSELNGSKVIQALGGVSGSVQDWIVVIGLIDSSGTTQSGTVSISRTVPTMDYVCEAGNRLWGCYYGNAGGENINEIYCCALGDFKNWHQFQGLSTDSWAASVGSDGQWTGAVNYLGNPVFFKENRIHQVGISSSGAHQLTETICRGVQKGSHKSLVVVGETLLYKSRTDICAWQGGFPQSVSPQLGDVKYYDAVAGAFGSKYYISMKTRDGVGDLFTYDLEKGLWCRESSWIVTDFAKVNDSLLAISGYKLYDLMGQANVAGITETPENSVTWIVETGIQTYEYPDKKYLSRFDLRMKMEKDAFVAVFLKYDSKGEWENKGTYTAAAAETRTVTLPIRPKRCDHLQMKISGAGDVKILSIARILETGSDV